MEKLLRESFPPRPPEWKYQLRPLATVVLERFDRRAVAVCDNNPVQLDRGYYRVSLHGGRAG